MQKHLKYSNLSLHSDEGKPTAQMGMMEKEEMGKVIKENVREKSISSHAHFILFV